MEGSGIARVGEAWTIPRRWIRIERSFHKREVVVGRGFTVRESGMEKYLTSLDHLASGKPRVPAIRELLQATRSMILPMCSPDSISR
jgi:hypothetical protein